MELNGIDDKGIGLWLLTTHGNMVDISPALQPNSGACIFV